jgi:branched-chain amino acid transport system permease protein
MLVWHWPLLLALPFGVIIGGLAGVLLDLVAVAPLQARGGGFLTPLISTIAAGIIFENIALNRFGPDSYSFPADAFPQGQISIGDAVVQPVELFIVALTVLLMVGLTVLLRYSKLGKAIRAVAANRLAANLLGIDVGRTVAITFFLASALGALAGIFYGLDFQDSIVFNMGGSIQLRGLAVIVVGGMDSIPGVMLGALFLAASETISVNFIGSAYVDAIAFGLLFLVLLVRPSGILGRRGLRAA